ncbi:TatD family hydrolase [Methylomonas sp. MgM2]
MRPQTNHSLADYPTIDIHSHRLKTTDHWQIISVDTHQIIETDDREPRQSPSSHKRPLEHVPAINLPSASYFSLGIHPWFIERQDINVAIQTLETYCHHPKLLAIGECGLDKTLSIDLSAQSIVFRRQIELSERWKKPLIIHCVRAFNELMQIKKSVNTAVPWIVHGYNNKPELAKQLLRHGFYLSLGKVLLNPQSNAYRVLGTMPFERLFLETDDADDLSINAIYAAAAKITGLTADALRRQIFHNFKRVFLQ